MPVRRRRMSLAIPVVLSVAVALGACAKGDQDGAAANGGDSARPGGGTASKCSGDNAGLTLPDGFCASVFADSVGRARHVAVADNGDVYVTIDGTQPPRENAPKEPQAPGVSVIALRDSTGDGKADTVARIGSLGNTGIQLWNGYLYVDEGKQIVRYKRGANELKPSGRREVVVFGLPLLPGHRARNIAIGPDSALYVNVGSATNSCQQKERANESPGIDPCVELQTRAGTWKFSATRTGQTFTPRARFATGIRNGMGLTVNPADGTVWQTQHGRDQLFQNWEKVFPSPKYSAENPAEELMQVSQGDDFGWPYCYYAVDEKKRVTAPEYGGDGKKTDRCGSAKDPAATFPGHWAPMAVMFYTGNQFPAKYRNGAFITFHGSWNRAPEHQAGYRIVFQPLSGGKGSGDYETFANGFATMPDAELQPGNARHRPMGIAMAPDGSLYVTDDKGGRVYRITYEAK